MHAFLFDQSWFICLNSRPVSVSVPHFSRITLRWLAAFLTLIWLVPQFYRQNHTLPTWKHKSISIFWFLNLVVLVCLDIYIFHATIRWLCLDYVSSMKTLHHSLSLYFVLKSRLHKSIKNLSICRAGLDLSWNDMIMLELKCHGFLFRLDASRRHCDGNRFTLLLHFVIYFGCACSNPFVCCLVSRRILRWVIMAEGE